MYIIQPAGPVDSTLRLPSNNIYHSTLGTLLASFDLWCPGSELEDAPCSSRPWKLVGTTEMTRALLRELYY